MSEWKPIETAPKEPYWSMGLHSYGPHILAYSGGEVLRCRWWQSKSGASNFIADGGLACTPTHWMPLPPPPSPKETGNE